MNRNHIIYVGNFCISEMDAQSQLIIGNSLALQALGFKVTMVGNDSSLVGNKDPLHSRYTLPEGIECFNIPFCRSIKELLGGQQLRSLELIMSHIGLSKIKYIICYRSLGFANLIFGLSNFAHKNGIKIIYNCADIHDMNHGSLIERIIKKANRWLLHQAISKKMDGLIAVSHYIKDYFATRTRYPIVVIPPLKDTKLIIPSNFIINRKTRCIVYAGVPFPIDGRAVNESAYKDRIDLFIDLLSEIEDIPYRLDIYGVEKEQYTRVVTRQKEILDRLSDRIVFHGRIIHNKTIEIVSSADYTVIYRLKNQMTMAGFSTKFVESICCGTPPIVTDTSDYIKYCGKGAEIIVLDTTDKNRQVEVIRDCLLRSDKEILFMKESCFNSKLFDYRNYVPVFKSFLEQIEQMI